MHYCDSGNLKHNTNISIVCHKNMLQYSAHNSVLWNSFISRSKNSNFQHKRSYLEYHADRFMDNSLLFMKDNNVQGLLPANIKDNTLYSHNGITFGGLLVSPTLKQKEVLHMFDDLQTYAQQKSITKIVFRPQPHIYNRYFAEEMLYALFKNDAVITARSISSVINLDEPLAYGKGRKWSLKKAMKQDISMSESKNFVDFMELEKELLKNKYGAVPVHSAKELRYLSTLYPDNIKLYTVNFKDKMIGGVMLFLMGDVVKCQYICSNDLCKELNALDLLFTELIKKYSNRFKYFDFGHSNLKNGRYLEDTLIQNKESYGARGVCYDTYTINL